MHTINLSQNTFVTFVSVATGKELVILIDTGAKISTYHIIKIQAKNQKG